MLEGMGYDTGVDMELLLDAGEYAAAELARDTESRAARALLAKRRAGAESNL